MKQRGKFILFLALFLILTTLVQAGELKVTQEHPFLVDNQWIPASDLQVGDILKTADGKSVRITNIQDVETEEPFLVYNLEAGIYHNFIVGLDNLIAHNSNRPRTILSKSRLKTIIAEDPTNIYADKMSDLTFRLKPRTGNFEDEFFKMGSGRASIALQQGDDDFAREVMRSLGKIQGGQGTGITYSPATPTSTRYPGLYQKIQEGIFRNPREALRVRPWNSMAEPEMALKNSYFGQYIQEGISVYEKTYFIEGREMTYRIFNLIEPYGGGKPAVIIQHIGTGPNNEVITNLGKIWNRALTSPSIRQRADAIAEFEWLYMTSNPLGRGGASTGDSLSLALQMENGFSLRPKYDPINRVDFNVLSAAEDAYIKARGLDIYRGSWFPIR